jgi:ABC-type glycerol-3-phosphate transport system substrate-binding protein
MRTVSRRALLAGLAAGASAVALPRVHGAIGRYRLDLGGYAGPALTTAPITLRFMRQNYSPYVNGLFEGMYARFTAAYPNITIKEEKVPYGDMPRKIAIYMASGTAPDIMMGRTDFTPVYHAGRIALPLQPYLSGDYLSDILPRTRTAASAGGNLYGMPWETYALMLYFNRDIFRRAGIESPPEVTDLTAGWSAEQYLNTMNRLTRSLRAKGDAGTWALAAAMQGNGGPAASYTQLESFWVRSQGDPDADRTSSAYRTLLGVSEDGLKATGYLDTPEAIRGMRNYQRLFTDRLTPTGVVPNQYQSGVAATYFGSPNLATIFLQPGRAPGFNWGVTPTPRGRIVFNALAMDSPIIWSKCPHPAEAAALLAFICNNPNRIAFHRAWGCMPSRQSLIDAMDEYRTREPLKLAIAVANAAYSAPRTPGWFEYYNAVSLAVKDIALGSDPAERLHTTAVRIDSLLRKYR